MIEIKYEQVKESRDSQRRYDALYRGRGITQLDSFYLWILHILKVKAGQTLLDISTGEGALVDFAKRRGLQAYGFDFSPVAVRIASQRHVNNIWLADAERLSLSDHQFDYVVNLGSLEHYMNMELSIRESVRMLRPNGWACYLLPNTYSLLGNVKYAWRFGDVFDDGQPLQRYNTRLGWQHLLEANGLDVKRVLKYEYEWPRTWHDFIWDLRRPMKMLHLFVSLFMPTNLANCVVFLCQPKETNFVSI